MPKTIDQTYNKDVPSLVKLKPEDAMQIIAKQLSLIESGFSVTNGMTADSYRLASELILEEYPNLKCNEIQLIIKNAIKGKYGESYNRVDVAVVMNWVKQYYEEREQLHTIMRERDHEQRKKEYLAIDEVTPEQQDRFRKIAEKWRISYDEEIKRKQRIAEAQINGKEPDAKDMRKI